MDNVFDIARATEIMNTVINYCVHTRCDKCPFKEMCNTTLRVPLAERMMIDLKHEVTYNG